MSEQLDLFEFDFNGNEIKEKLPKAQEDTDKKLTPRQWATYRLIKENSLNGRKTTQKEIFEKVDGYVWNEEISAHDHCVAIGSDIRIINLSYETEKIICYKDFEYWLGTKEETENFIDDLWTQLAPRLYRYWFYKKKISNDGQCQLLSRQLKPIDETSKAREYIESFLNLGE